MIQQIPETASNPVGFAYVILLMMLIDQIGKETLRLYPNDKIVLYHDHCAYDAALADSFEQMVDGSIFSSHNLDRFVSITPARWENCVLLQPADMIAYENFKEGMRKHYPSGRNRRKSLNALLDLNAISGRTSGFTSEAIQELKKTIADMEPRIKQRLFDAARIKTSSTNT
jgi:hypothetical protein